MKKSTKEAKAMFNTAREEGRLDDAFNLWIEIQSDVEEKKQADWCDHNSRYLFQDYYNRKDWVNTKRVCEATMKLASKVGRINRLEELSGLKYDEI